MLYNSTENVKTEKTQRNMQQKEYKNTDQLHCTKPFKYVLYNHILAHSSFAQK